MNRSLQALTETLRNANGAALTIAQLAATTGISLSRTRELAPEIEGVVIDRAAKPMTFSIPVAAPVEAKPTRKLLNPQPVIEAKKAALAAKGATLVYASRTWAVSVGDSVVATLTSREFSALSAEELVALLP